MREYRYFLCDVFTQTRFGGNQLAVLPEAAGLSGEEMQQIAREFNFSESSFVLPADEPFTRQVRIFTPAAEVPFAGHPNIGTAFALATDGALGSLDGGRRVLFDEKAGPVAITISEDDAGIRCELQAPQGLTRGPTVAGRRIAGALNLLEGDIVTRTHEPQVASVGLPFLVAELANVDALRRARADMAELEQLRDDGIVPDIFVYTHSNDDFDIRARMFAPFDGVPEDPATGSANGALAALLTECAGRGDATYRWRIAQGVEMGRPSVLDARTSSEDAVVTTWIGGYCVLVGEGVLTLD